MNMIQQYMYISIKLVGWCLCVQWLLQVFRPRTPPEAVDLACKLLDYTPNSRISPLQACAHSFFDELRDPNGKLPNGRPFPALFNFTQEGLYLILTFIKSYNVQCLQCYTKNISLRTDAFIESGHDRYKIPSPTYRHTQHVKSWFVLTELMVDTSLNDKLIPPHARGQTASARASSTTVNGAQAV